MTDAADRARYVETLNAALEEAGYVIIATFGLEGPERCSGLDVVRYSPKTLRAELGTAYRLLEVHDEMHDTPSWSTQAFTYCLFQKSGSRGSG